MPMEMVDNEAELARTTSGLIGVHERSCKYDPQNAPWPIGVAAGMPQYLANHNAISHYFNKVDRQKLRYLQNHDVISGKIQPDPRLVRFRFCQRSFWYFCIQSARKYPMS